MPQEPVRNLNTGIRDLQCMEDHGTPLFFADGSCGILLCSITTLHIPRFHWFIKERTSFIGRFVVSFKAYSENLME